MRTNLAVQKEAILEGGISYKLQFNFQKSQKTTKNDQNIFNEKPFSKTEKIFTERLNQLTSSKSEFLNSKLPHYIPFFVFINIMEGIF